MCREFRFPSFLALPLTLLAPPRCSYADASVIVLLANSTAGLKQKDSTQHPSGMSRLDAPILDSEKALVWSLGATGFTLPPWTLGVKRAAAALENDLPEPSLADRPGNTVSMGEPGKHMQEIVVFPF